MTFDDMIRDLGPEMISSPEPRHLEDPRGRVDAQALALARPRDTEEAVRLVRYAAEYHLALVPYSGGTGLVLGQVALSDAETSRQTIIVSLERMRAIRAFYPQESVMIAEAGVSLQTLQEKAADEGQLFPLAMASQGSAAVGGFLSTNAGGVNVLRYGNARDLCLGVEAVLPNGEIFHGLKRLRKDNTGYDLRHLLIGAEGTLGIITAAAFKLMPAPKSQRAAMFVVASPQAAVDLLSRAHHWFGPNLSAFELIAKASFEFLAHCFADMRQPFDPAPDWAVLIDLGFQNAEEDDTLIEGFFTEAMEAGEVLDGTLAQSMGQRQDFWTLREHIPLANRQIGSVSNHDIALPISAIPEFLAKVPKKLGTYGDFRINAFGHLGDGNLHFNIFAQEGQSPKDHWHLRHTLKQVVHDEVHALGGTFSAEHGIGRLKTDDLERYGDPGKLWAMRQIKSALDPHNIMNPGAVLKEKR